MLLKRFSEHALLPRTPAYSDGAEIGEPPDSSLPTIPQATDRIRQLTARSARRVARHDLCCSIFG